MLILLIPFMSILSAVNLALRMPDLYQFDLNRTENIDKLGLDTDSESMSSFISDFMFNKEPRFNFIDIFTKNDEAFMSALRGTLNMTLVLILLALIFIIFTYFFLLRQNRKEALRVAFKYGTLLYFFSIVIIIISLVITSLRKAITGLVIPFNLTKSDMLLQLFSQDLVMPALIAIVIISFIVMVIIRTLTWKMTKPERIFWPE